MAVSSYVRSCHCPYPPWQASLSSWCVVLVCTAHSLEYLAAGRLSTTSFLSGYTGKDTRRRVQTRERVAQLRAALRSPCTPGISRWFLPILWQAGST
jgi:hypothetical protein